MFILTRLMKRKRKNKRTPKLHSEFTPMIFDGNKVAWSITMPDGRRGELCSRGTLDRNGSFYEMIEGRMGLVQELANCEYAYVPLRLLRISTLSI